MMTTEELERKLGVIRDLCQTQLTIIDRAITELIDPDLGLEQATLDRLPRVLRDTWIDLIRGGDLSISIGLDLEMDRSDSEQNTRSEGESHV